ncbi:MAG: methyltransferase family protein [Burkholderiales bacterium]|jgi:protein-S-isoprenylcysteine O-methyltransferase Ste14
MRLSTSDLPAAVTLLAIWLYWIIVGAMIVRRRRKTRKLAGVLPEQGVEAAMWIVWVPLVAAWLVLPWLAVTHEAGTFAVPAFARAGAYLGLRALAALAALAALYGSIRAWRQMGSHWTMAVTRDESATLLTAGVFSRIRHPIYAFSIVLMLATLVVIPTWPMLLVAAVHVTLMALKARNEERFLLAAHGERYASYCRHTGRFVPRFMGPR